MSLILVIIKIQKFLSNMAINLHPAMGSQGNGVGEFLPNWYREGINAAINVFAVDNGNSRIQVFDSNGAFLRQWTSWCRQWSVL